MPGRTQVPCERVAAFSRTGLLPSMAAVSTDLPLTQRFVTSRPRCGTIMQSPTTPEWKRPQAIAPSRFGLIPFRSPLLRESSFFLFLRLLRCFSSPAYLHSPYVFRWGYPRITTGGFPHSEILGSKLGQQLPGAYRSRPRPSSALGAKASTVCPCSLDHEEHRKFAAMEFSRCA